MFVVVALEKIKINLVIPLNWVYSFNPSDIVNNAVNTSEVVTIFYNENLNVQANFSLPIVEDFNQNIPNCYEARMMKFFGKLLLVLLFVIAKDYQFISKHNLK